MAKLIKKELQQLKTDPLYLLIALLIPPLIVAMFSLMMNQVSTTSPLKVCVISYDSGNYFNGSTYDEFTIPYLEAVNESNKLDLQNFYNGSEEKHAINTARKNLITGNIRVIIIIPIDFSENIKNGYSAIIECIPDSSNYQQIQENLNAVHDSIKIFVENNGLNPQFILQEYEEFTLPSNYNFKYNYDITLTISMIIFGISTVLTILVITREHPIARLLLTPYKRTEIIFSKYITYSIILAIQIGFVTLSALINGLYVAGLIFDLYIGLFMVGFCSLSTGIFISSISRDQVEANQLFFAIFLTVFLLSGIFIPVETMPEYLQIIASFLPLSHGTPLVREITSKGNSVIGYHFYWLLAYSLTLFILSFIIFNKRNYEA